MLFTRKILTCFCLNFFKNIKKELPQLLDNSYTELFSTNVVERSNSETSLLTSRNGNSNKSLRRIPLLESVFESFPDMRINLDIKVHNDELIQKVGIINNFNS